MIWILLLLAVAAAPFVIEALRKPVDRTQASGQFADLPGGTTHYSWTGPDDGPVVVCVHGLTTPSFVWRGVAAGLAAAGYRVLSYDLYGRGYSERVRGVQSDRFFVTQLDELLADQGVEQPFVLIGYSMGGAIVTAFAARFPARIRRLVLLAPAGMGHQLGPLARFIRGAPGIGDWLFRLFYPAQLRKGIEAERPLPGSVPGIADLQLAELDHRGFLPAVLSSLRHMLGAPLERYHRTIADAGLPVLAIWGVDDDVIPLAAKDRLTGWNPAARHVVIDGAGHGVTYTHTDQVLDAILPAD
ncbi:MAG: alpha/beta hydrolase [Marinibacterium sp.]|nr:alpha/beta hydrolase [Marinibacterium sp.]